eukprot:6093907-Amphidinium_carterae.1
MISASSVICLLSSVRGLQCSGRKRWMCCGTVLDGCCSSEANLPAHVPHACWGHGLSQVCSTSSAFKGVNNNLQ